MIYRAIFLVIDGINLASLENLLYIQPEIGIKHSQELKQLLKPQGLARYSIHNMLKAEYHFVNQQLLSTPEFQKGTHVEFIRNYIYRFHLDFLNKAQQPIHTFEASAQEFKKKYKVSTATNFLARLFPRVLTRDLSRIAANLYISGQSNGLSLVNSMHSKSAMMNMLDLSIKIRQQNLDSNQIQPFLNNAGAEYTCPFTEKPMVYDAVKKIIYCKKSEDKNDIFGLNVVRI